MFKSVICTEKPSKMSPKPFPSGLNTQVRRAKGINWILRCICRLRNTLWFLMWGWVSKRVCPICKTKRNAKWKSEWDIKRWQEFRILAFCGMSYRPWLLLHIENCLKSGMKYPRLCVTRISILSCSDPLKNGILWIIIKPKFYLRQSLRGSLDEEMTF